MQDQVPHPSPAPCPVSSVTFLGSTSITLRPNGTSSTLRLTSETVPSSLSPHSLMSLLSSGRLVPLYTNSNRKLKVLDLVVINRSFPSSSVPSTGSPEMEIFGFPFMFQVESFRSCEHVYRHLVEQSLRYLSPEELESLTAKGLFDLNSSNSSSSSSPAWINTDLLPFKIRSFFLILSLRPTPFLSPTVSSLSFALLAPGSYPSKRPCLCLRMTPPPSAWSMP
jgi:hypothetical protein